MRLVIHVPHASTSIPAEYRDQFLLPDSDLEAEAAISADLHTDALAREAWPQSLLVEAGMSRIVCDVERYADDEHEEMATVGRGMIYAKTHDGQPLRRPISPVEREELRQNYYEPHWGRLREAARGNVLVDLHSYPVFPWNVEIKKDADRPEIDIGTTPGVTPRIWDVALVRHFGQAGYQTGLNTPYAGVVDAGARAAVMIEIRRDVLGAPGDCRHWERLVSALGGMPLYQD